MMTSCEAVNWACGCCCVHGKSLSKLARCVATYDDALEHFVADRLEDVLGEALVAERAVDRGQVIGIGTEQRTQRDVDHLEIWLIPRCPINIARDGTNENEQERRTFATSARGNNVLVHTHGVDDRALDPWDQDVRAFIERAITHTDEAIELDGAVTRRHVVERVDTDETQTHDTEQQTSDSQRSRRRVAQPRRQCLDVEVHVEWLDLARGVFVLDREKKRRVV